MHDSDDAATQRYLELIRSVHDEWTSLEEQGDHSVQLSATALSTIKESVRADVRHGAQVQMPPTAAGPYTLSELALRTLVRRAVDSVPGVIALRTTVEHEPGENGLRTRGTPARIRCRISAPATSSDLLQLADDVRAAVTSACRDQVGLDSTVVDIHIEDIHEH
ncbi:hypothetical protein [Brachybacterium sp. YJGR34]|uniref:hypothetical protein n=1 Tax=Brachybacterium sp. YJGR34 TaxID=2059911 RepID=UPI001E39EFCF|nr:hypothetical protein [Brachybacterium sp. YJGR34]